jgi:hypothetical protein
MRVAATISILAALTWPATAAPDYSGTYLCVTEAAGGLWFNKSADRWEGATFTPEGKRVVRVTRAGVGIEKNFTGKDVEVSRYTVMVKAFGEASEQQCFARFGKDRNVALEGDSAWIWCSAMLDDFQVNFANGRFLSVYPIGFVDGDDTNENTPHVQGGRCERIE